MGAKKKASGFDSYKILLEDGGATVCRGLHSTEGETRNVLAVIPASDAPPDFLDRLRHEYGLREALDSGWAARPLELVETPKLVGRWRGPLLLLGDPGGEFLESLLGQPMQAERFLRLALGITRATRKLHHQGLIHKDITPAHILVDQTSGAAWLTGFGIATRLPRERTLPDPPELIAGTLAYMAPEQTGRMNRSIDARSDLYALGVIFYRMLTGRLPFTASDPMEWVHCHIARKPAQPCALVRTIPIPLSAILMKLLAKTVEERYQTAAGLESDLERCLAEWRAHGRIDAFSLGEHDTPDRLLIPEKLYGREHEIGTLLAAFERVVKTGRSELVLVSGYSGVGKSSVVNELHKVLVPPRGLFASGKFDQYKRGIPYSTLAQAFRKLVQPLLGKSDAELANWREALREALGPNGLLMVDLVPELELIVGEQPPVEALEPQQMRALFQLVFRRFLGVFARPEHPLALFLDDLQWLDAATLDLLEDLSTKADVQHLLLIGAYRDNEVDAFHPLWRKLAAIRAVGAPVQEITLSPLAPEDLGQLVADALHCEPERARPLAELVHRKTAGNPFFAIQFLLVLTEEGLISFDHAGAQWSWDMPRIQAKGYTGNVVDLMIGKLTRLPEKTQNALEQLACLGNIAGIAPLSIIQGTSEAEVQANLQEAVGQELIVRVDDSYKFFHDRIQEAAYALIPEDGRAAAHLRIGRLLLAHTPPEQRDEKVFEIVSQFNRGAGLMDSREEREQLAGLNLIAGKRAKASTAYASALAYLSAGAALLVDDCWQRRYELIFQLELQRAECEFLTAEFATVEERLTMLWGRAANVADQAAVTCLRIDLYTTVDRSERAVAAGLDYLRQVGVDWPAHPSKEVARREYERIWLQLGSRTTEELVDLPLMRDPALLATMDVLLRLRLPALITDANLFCLVISKAVNFSLEHGNSDGACWAYVSLGTIAGPYFGDYKAGSQFGQFGYELVEKRGLNRFLARTYMIFGSQVLPWTRHVRAGRDLLHRAFDAANRIGDLTYAAANCHFLITNLFMGEDSLPGVQREAERSLAFTQKVQFGLVTDLIVSKLSLIRTLRGSTRKFGCFDDEQFNERQFERHLSSKPGWEYAECGYWVRKLQARFFAGDHAAAIEAASKAGQLLWTLLPQLETAEYHFYGALARAACCDRAVAGERQEHLKALAAHLRQLEIWAENGPENFENRAALVAAEIARLEGRPLDAERLYEEAIKSACANGFVQNEALANELTAQFFLARGLSMTGLAHLRDARACYVLWGADGKVQQLDRKHPQLAASRARLTPRASDPALQQLDISTVFRASNAVSGEIELPKLIETLMTIALENAGADRGLLILPQVEGYRVEVEAQAASTGIEVRLRGSAIKETACPESVINYVIRTHKSVILDDGSQPGMDFEDSYFRNGAVRSVFCLPLLRAGELGGVLYLENSQATYAFTPDRIAVLDVLAVQAAISLEKARLYSDLKAREVKIRRLVDSNIIGIFIWRSNGQILEANEAFLAMVGHSRDDLVSGRVSWAGMTPPEWQDANRHAIEQLKERGTCRPFEKEYFHKDGSRIPVLIGLALFEGSENEGVAFVLDLTQRKEAEKRQAVMVDELNHRVKNTLATVMALSAQTFRTAPSPEAFCEAFEGRLLALSQTHNLLNRSFWTGAGLRDVLTQELAPYNGADGCGFRLDGDEIKLRPVAAVTLGMVFHELATNAAKYGALSVTGGKVLVAWRVSRTGRLHVEWREMGGPPVSPPQRRGFGSRLIEQALAGDLNGSAHIYFSSEGVRCLMDIPLYKILAH